MKSSTKDKIKGSFHKVKGTIKEEVGKVTNDRNLKAERESRKEGGQSEQARLVYYGAVFEIKKEIPIIDVWTRC